MSISKVLAPFFFLASLLLAFSGALAQQVMQARIYPADKVQAKEILSLNLDVAYVDYGRYIDIITHPEEVEQLRSAGYDVEIVHQDLVAFYQSRLETDKDMRGYHTYAEIGAALDSMHTLYPSITSDTISIGLSLEGRPIWAFKISDNPDMDEDEPEVFYNALIHAREPIGMEVLLYFMWHLLDNYGTDSLITHLVDNRELWFVPVVNPDGYEYNRQTNPNGGGMWRKNRRDCGDGNWGVDLNRNFGYMWGYDDEGSSADCRKDTYRGAGPFSEPETRVLRDFVNSRSFVMCLDNHAYGRWLIYPWSYDFLYTPRYRLYVSMAESMAVLNGHRAGTSWELLYLMNGASIDWEYGDTLSRSMIIATMSEIGYDYDGFWPPTNRLLPLCEMQLSSNFLYAELADNPYRLLPPRAPVLTEIDTVFSGFTVFWSFNDSLNPASAFELAEMTGFERVVYDVESDHSGWDLDGFAVSTDRSHSPTHSFYSGQGEWLRHSVTTVNSISVEPGDSLKMWCWYDIEEDWDYAYVEISTDGGYYFFSIPGNITTDYDPNGFNFGNGITGSSYGWVEGRFDLGDYLGRKILVRLRYITDGLGSLEGFYADDISPFERYESSVSLSAAIADTFFWIQDQPQGTYFYKVRAKDAQDQWSLWSNVETAVVTSGFMPGDANGDGLINLGDIACLVTYLYRSGSVPSPLDSGDANCDGIVNVADVVCLVNYLYRAGNPPGC
jgi:hypothetical protein